MPGFMEIAVNAEHFGQAVVNTFHYRGENWNVLSGNPFADGLKVVQDFWSNIHTEWLALFNANYRVLAISGVGYSDAYDIVTASPVLFEVNQPGALAAAQYLETTGSSVCANLSFRLGAQHQINGTGKSLRNRGYIALGPVPEVFVDSYGHFVNNYDVSINLLAQKLDDTLIDVELLGNFVPIRAHVKYVKNILTGKWGVSWRTYSDILGYRLPRVASWRRSRQPEA